MTNPQINTKSIARIAAIQTLYQFASSKGESDINSSLARMKEFYKDEDFKSDHEVDEKSKLKLRPSYTYLEELVKHAHDNLAQIDEIISKHLTKEWTLANIPMLLHAVLRVAICEINYFPETPKKVILNEYTDIASDMLDDNEIGFVNSVLHTYANSR
jgi:N utilization substance protein B